MQTVLYLTFIKHLSFNIMKLLLKLCLLTAFLFFSFNIQAQEKPIGKELKPALLILDVQKAYLPYMSQEDQEAAINYMNWAIWLFRKFDLPVIRIYHTDDKTGPAPGSPAFEFADSLNILESDPRVIKKYPSAFNKTDLDDILKEKDVNTVFICGLSAVGCALATYFDTYNYEYKGFLINNALLSHNAEYTEHIEEIFDALDLETIKFMLEISK